MASRFEPLSNPTAKETHRLKISKALQKAAGANTGDTVNVEITRVGEESGNQASARAPQSLGRRPTGADHVGGDHPSRAPRLDPLDHLRQTIRKPASSESKKLATCWPPESGASVVSAVSTGSRKIIRRLERGREFRYLGIRIYPAAAVSP